MTRMSYEIYLDGHKINNNATYKEALAAQQKWGKGITFKAVYQEFNPIHTHEYKKACHLHAMKITKKSLAV